MSRMALEFQGRIAPGSGRFSEMVIAGRSALRDVDPEWPEELCPGSLNVFVEGYPPKFSRAGTVPRTTTLDDAVLAPEFIIPGRLIKNNLLTDPQGEPRDAQVWRARLTVPEKRLDIQCWVLRRFASRMDRWLELVSAENLRATYGLEDGDRVVVTMYEGGD